MNISRKKFLERTAAGKIFLQLMKDCFCNSGIAIDKIGGKQMPY
jgi:hypothetical protein